MPETADAPNDADAHAVPLPVLLSISEAARLANVSRPIIRAAIDNGQLPFIQLPGGRRQHIDRADLADGLRSLRRRNRPGDSS